MKIVAMTLLAGLTVTPALAQPATDQDNVSAAATAESKAAVAPVSSTEERFTDLMSSSHIVPAGTVVSRWPRRAIQAPLAHIFRNSQPNLLVW